MAMEAFARAADLDPGNKQYVLAGEVARQHLVRDLIQQADKDKILGHLADSRAKITEALRIDPSNPIAEQHADELASSTVAGEPAMQSEVSNLAGPIELQPKAVRRSFHVRARQRDLIQQVLSAYGIQTTMDDSVTAQTVRYDVDDADFPDAVRTLGLITGTFLVPLDPARALVAKDTRANHDKYEREALETVYMPGMKPEELTQVADIAKNVFNAKSASNSPGSNAITIRAAAGDLAALNSTLTGLLQGRGEIQLDVRMYEVDRTKATNLGVILPNQLTVFNVYSEANSILQSNSSLVEQIISSGLAAPGDWEAILAILIASGQVTNSVLSQPLAVFGGGLTMTGITTSGASLNMQLNSSDARSVDQMQLRVLDQEEATIRAGERYPIITSSYSSLSPTSPSIAGLSTAGISSTLQSLGLSASQLQAEATEAIPQVQYQDIGLTLKVTPRIQGPRDVSLNFDLQLSSLAGSSLNDLPLLDNREYSAHTSLPIGQSAVVVTALSRQQSDAITGFPGLSDLPGFQDTTNKDSNLNVSELAVVITPHIVRSTQQQAAEKMVLLPRQP